MSGRRKKNEAITLTVPAKTVLPAFYHTATPEEVAEALHMGALVVETVQSAHATKTAQEYEEAKTAEVSLIREQAEKALADLQAQLDAERERAARASAEHNKHMRELLDLQATQQDAAATQAQAATTDRLTREFTAKLRAAEHDLLVAQERCNGLQERKTILEQGRDQDIRAAEERTRRLMQEALDEKERAIQRLMGQLTSTQDLLSRQSTELQTLGDLIRRKNTNVKSKGNEYESIFREKLLAAFGVAERFELEDSARNGVGHAGDYLMKYGDHTILWELKNYDRPVPSAEVDKFRRDMRENPHASIGVMVSRYTPITGKTSAGDRELEVREGQLLIYLSNFEAMSEDTLPALIFPFKLWWQLDKPANDDERQTSVLRTIERLHEKALKSKVEWRLHKAHMESSLRWMATTVEEHEQQLQNAVQLLLGSKMIEVPPNIFRDVAGNEKDTALIQLILEHTDVVEGGSLILNDLADIVATAKNISRDTAKSHIRAILLDAAYEPPKGKYPGKLLGLALKSPTAGTTIEHA
jgi:hypothetical protein